MRAGISPRLIPGERSDRAFLAGMALIFGLSVTITIFWCLSMSSMAGMQMPGGWTMSMAWMRMPAQTWLGAATTFLGMWIVMMVAMMLPSLVPMLIRYRRELRGVPAVRLGRLTAMAAAGYFLVWTLLGAVIFPMGVALTTLQMQHAALSRVVPMASGVVVLMAGVLQFSAWKAHHLACCREAAGHDCARPVDASSAWQHGVRLGLHCLHCCGGFMAMLLVLGVMDLRVMAVVMGMLTAERLAPAGAQMARVLGVIITTAGVVLIILAV